MACSFGFREQTSTYSTVTKSLTVFCDPARKMNETYSFGFREYALTYMNKNLNGVL